MSSIVIAAVLGLAQAAINHADYPMSALLRGAEGTVGFQLDIDDRGRATNCVIIQSSNEEDLDRATCALMLSRARFRPARGAEGQRVADRYRGRVVWRIPEDGVELLPSRQVPIRFVTSLSSNEDGLMSCSVNLNGDEARLANINQCGLLSFSNAPAALQRLGPNSALTLVVAIWADRTSPPDVGSGEFGDLSTEVTGAFSVNSRGYAIRCDSEPIRISRRIAGLTGAADNACNFVGLSNRPLFEPEPADAPVRFGHVRVQVFARRPAERRSR